MTSMKNVDVTGFLSASSKLGAVELSLGQEQAT